jgi:hypothetical protein
MYEFLINQTYERPPRQGVPAYSILRVDSDGLHIADYGTEVLRPWSAVKSVHAFSRTPLVASNLAMVIGFSDGRVALVSDDEAHWYAMALALSEQLPGVSRYAEWSLRLRADPQETLQLF